MKTQISGAKCPYCGATNSFAIQPEVLYGMRGNDSFSFEGYTVLCTKEDCGKFISFLPFGKIDGDKPD